VGGTAGTGDDDVEPVVPGGADIVGQGSGVAVCAEDSLLVRNPKFFEGGAGRGHDVPITRAAHNDGYLAHSLKSLLTDRKFKANNPAAQTQPPTFFENVINIPNVEIFC
jgi:hypothetical protein